ncbi:MAG: four helix bundle protein [Candidatus Omnitrophica bacterium]|nr:four helix bundle protein [Candidatus Omnitrophota bacterium]
MKERKDFDIYDRAFKFAVRTAKTIDQLPLTQTTREYGKQLIRASGSVGSNLEEADGALTRKDFINKIGISRREARESRYWLKLLEATTNFTDKTIGDEIRWLINESKEIMLILSSIIK